MSGSQAAPGQAPGQKEQDPRCLWNRNFSNEALICFPFTGFNVSVKRVKSLRNVAWNAEGQLGYEFGKRSGFASTSSCVAGCAGLADSELQTNHLKFACSSRRDALWQATKKIE